MASKQLMILATLAVLLCCSLALPNRNRQPLQILQHNHGKQLINGLPNHGYPASASLPPVVNNFLRSGVPNGAQLINVQPQLQAISQRLPDNYTLIRPNVVDTFRCEGSEFPKGYRNYGYYADQDNECQIFHVCLPLQQLYPDNFTTPITYQFSFICPEYTIFTQDALVCQWSDEALPCEHAQELYSVNDYFFTDKGTDGEIWGQKVTTDS